MIMIDQDPLMDANICGQNLRRSRVIFIVSKYLPQIVVNYTGGNNSIAEEPSDPTLTK